MPPRTLTDGDLRLRPADLEHDPPLAVPWYQDLEVLLHSEGGAEPYGLPEVRVMFFHLAAQGELYIVETLAGGHWLPIGDATLMRDDLPIVIGEEAYRSKGLGRRVLALLVRRAQELQWSTVRVKAVYTSNIRAKRLFEGGGFRLTRTVDQPGGVRPYWSFELPVPPIANAWLHDALVREVNMPALERAEEFAAAEVDWLVGALGATPGQTLLDIGCGLGRHALELARRGFNTVGVDVSPLLVGEARRRALGVGPGNLSFLELDMRALDAREEYDHAYCLFESGFGRLGDDGSHVDFLRRVYGALRPGGRFALGVRNVYRWAACRHENFDLVHGRMPWTTGDAAGASGEPYGLRDTVRGFTPPEVRLLATAAGLEVHSHYGLAGLGRGILPGIRLDDVELIVVLRKAPSV